MCEGLRVRMFRRRVQGQSPHFYTHFSIVPVLPSHIVLVIERADLHRCFDYDYEHDYEHDMGREVGTNRYRGVIPHSESPYSRYDGSYSTAYPVG